MIERCELFTVLLLHFLLARLKKRGQKQNKSQTGWRFTSPTQESTLKCKNKRKIKPFLTLWSVLLNTFNELNYRLWVYVEVTSNHQ